LGRRREENLITGSLSSKSRDEDCLRSG